MNTIELTTPADLSFEAAMAALAQVNLLEAGSLKKGVDFVELQVAPSLEQLALGEAIGGELLKRGVGVKLTIHWPFAGTGKWALQTERTRVVSGL